MEKYSRYSSRTEVIWSNHGPYTGKGKPVDHGGGWGCLFVVILVSVIALVEILGPDAFFVLMHEISVVLLGG